MFKVLFSFSFFILGTGAYASSLEERVRVLEEKVELLEQQSAPTEVIESSCLLNASSCVVFERPTTYGFYYKYSYSVRQNLAYIYQNGNVVKVTRERPDSFNSYPGSHFDTEAGALRACTQAIELLRASTPNC